MRRTKEEAERTRRRIIAAALRVFNRRGIAHATLEQIAKEAGVTRGAVYWHFDGKQALLRAIREAVQLPLIDNSDLTVLREADDDPLGRVERFLGGVARAIEHDASMRRALDVMSFKCEYVGDLAAEREALTRNSERLRGALERAYASAQRRGELRADLSPHVAAVETVAFLSGLVRLLLLETCGTAVAGAADTVIRAHVQSRRATNGARVDRARSVRVSATPSAR